MVKQLSDKQMSRVLSRMVEKGTPRENGKCKALRCKGVVVRRVTSLFRGHLSYGLPTCDKCGRVYLYAKNAPRVGASEFLESLNQPMTI